MGAESVFVTDGAAYQPTEWSVGPWAPDAVQGSAFAGLLARAVERVEHPRPMALSRLSFDLWRPVTRRPLALALSVLRDGQRARTVEASLLHEGTTLARCTALFLRADPGSVPPSEAPAAPAAGPEAGRPIPEHVRAWSPFFTGVDTRVIEGELQQPGPAAVWLSLRRPLVAGEENSPLVQAVSAADLASGISAVVDLRAWSFINADLTMTLWRRPEGSWILVRAETNPGDLGRGSALGALSDLWGPFGSCALNLIFERAARG